MARPKTSFPPVDQILALVDPEGRLTVRVTPNAGADAVTVANGEAGQALLVRTTASPENGRANEAVLRLIAKAAGCPRSSVELLRGQASRDKVVRIPFVSNAPPRL